MADAEAEQIDHGDGADADANLDAQLDGEDVDAAGEDDNNESVTPPESFPETLHSLALDLQCYVVSLCMHLRLASCAP